MEKKIENYSEILMCQLTQKEVSEYAMDLARKSIDLQSLEADKKSIVSEYKSKIDSAEAKIQEYSLYVTTAKESREVECEKIFDFIGSTITYIRTDTGEVLKARKMNENEKQYDIPHI